MYRNSSDSSSSEDESFCLQMKVQAIQKHLFTNLEFKVKSHKNKTKFLQARTDTCADVNIVPVSIYRYFFQDPDCAKIAQSDLQLGTCTNKKVRSRLLDLATYISYIQIQDVLKKYHSL